MSGPNSSHDDGQRTESSGEYQVMRHAIDSLESAFAGRAPAGDERAQEQRARRALVQVARLVEEHCELAEQRGGLAGRSATNPGATTMPKRKPWRVIH